MSVITLQKQMAKTRSSKKAKKARIAATRSVGARVRGTISEHMRKYIQLLEDPCNGPLVTGPGSGEGGSVVRCESDFLIGNGATDTVGFINWAPGAYSATTDVSGFGTLVGVGASDTGAITPSSAGVSNYAPGYNFLTGTAGSYRCLAACAQVFWPGSELNRSGVISMAQATYASLATNRNVSTANLRAMSPVVERMPQDHSECKWAPNFADGLFESPANTSSPPDGHGSIMISWAGLPVATGVRIRLVAVFEWRPQTNSTGSAFVLSSNTGSTDAGDVQAARRYLDNVRPGWWYRMGQAVYGVASGMTVAYMRERARSIPRIEL